MSIGVFCAVSNAEYPLLQYTLRPFLGRSGVERILILNTSPTHHSSFGMLSSASPQIVELHRNFGEGYELSVADGGYDQFSARNFAIDYFEDADVDWLIQFDADEFITEDGISFIIDVPDRYDVVAFSYYTLLSRRLFWFEPRIRRVVNGAALVDPHLLIWRRSLQKRNELCLDSARLHANHTRHCSVSFHHHPRWKVLPVDRPYHFHLHCMLGKKNSLVRRQTKEFECELPIDLLTCIDDLEKASLIRSRSDEFSC
jgi:hypothetical protein